MSSFETSCRTRRCVFRPMHPVACFLASMRRWPNSSSSGRAVSAWHHNGHRGPPLDNTLYDQIDQPCGL
jgi:hypothetical protein